VDSAYHLANIKNLVIVSSDEAKRHYINNVYPHNIDCVVLTQKEALDYDGDYKIVFIGCFLDKFSKCENIILDDIIKLTWAEKPYKLIWTEESLASFIGSWFGQGKLRKMHNNLQSDFLLKNRDDYPWLKNIMV
jgi:hypothetical protein